MDSHELIHIYSLSPTLSFPHWTYLLSKKEIVIDIVSNKRNKNRVQNMKILGPHTIFCNILPIALSLKLSNLTWHHYKIKTSLSLNTHYIKLHMLKKKKKKITSGERSYPIALVPTPDNSNSGWFLGGAYIIFFIFISIYYLVLTNNFN